MYRELILAWWWEKRNAHTEMKIIATGHSCRQPPTWPWTSYFFLTQTTTSSGLPKCKIITPDPMPSNSWSAVGSLRCLSQVSSFWYRKQGCQCANSLHLRAQYECGIIQHPRLKEGKKGMNIADIAQLQLWNTAGPLLSVSANLGERALSSFGSSFDTGNDSTRFHWFL